MTHQRAIVSCDIVGHSREKSPAAQLKQLQGINDLIKNVITQDGTGRVVWASRGDGGHIALASPIWAETALRLIHDLRIWSTASGVPLRIIAHYGEVNLFTGADGRTELVGDAINLVGRLIDYSSPERVVVSEDFVKAVGEPLPAGVRFHDPTPITPKYFPTQSVYLFSSGASLASAWGYTHDDRACLKKAQEEGLGWEVIYHSKRLMQINSSDPDAEQALRDVEAGGLQFRNHVTGKKEVNPVLGRVDSYPRVEFVRAAQLIERDDGDLLCDFNDPGDTMFVLLRGLIRIQPPGHPPSLRTTGDIVGELAFALHRSRTAAMYCVGRTALLGFTYQHLDAQLRKSPAGSASKEQLDRVLLSRILKYVCTTADYLLMADPSSPLHESRRPWELLLYHTARLPTFEDGHVLSFADAHFADDGIYILVSGRLRRLHPPHDILDGDHLPIVYAAFPDRFVSANTQYRVDGEAILVRIGATGLKTFGPLALKAVVEAVKATSGRQFAYDVFLSYTFDDQEIVLRWKDALERAGFRVFMDTANLLRRFPDQLAAAILDSLVLLPLVSANTMRRKPEENWVRSEIDYREACFDRDTANVLPVRLLGGNVATLAGGFVSVDADGREAEAMHEVIEAIRAVKEGRHPPPFATRRRLGVLLSGPS